MGSVGHLLRFRVEVTDCTKACEWASGRRGRRQSQGPVPKERNEAREVVVGCCKCCRRPANWSTWQLKQHSLWHSACNCTRAKPYDSIQAHMNAKCFRAVNGCQHCKQSSLCIGSALVVPT